MPEHRPPLWIVFGLNVDGYTEVLAIDTAQWIAARHREMMESSGHHYIRVWAEKCEANHLFGACMTSLLEHSEQQLDEKVREWVRTADLSDESLSAQESAALRAANEEIHKLKAENQRLCIIASEALRLLRERDAEKETEQKAFTELLREWDTDIGAETDND